MALKQLTKKELVEMLDKELGSKKEEQKTEPTGVAKTTPVASQQGQQRMPAPHTGVFFPNHGGIIIQGQVNMDGKLINIQLTKIQYRNKKTGQMQDMYTAVAY